MKAVPGLSQSVVIDYSPLESLEPRWMLSAPTFAVQTTDISFRSNGAIMIPVSGADADGDPLTITATSSNSNFQVSAPTGDTFAKLYFKDYQGAALGYILVELLTSRSYASDAAQRFIDLAGNQVNPDGSLDPNGTPFYTNVPVHRVIDGFMFQTGDAANGDGTGDSAMPDLNDSFDPFLSFAGPGVLGMAKSGNPNTSNCQFFITDGAKQLLDHNYIIFGQMIAGASTYQSVITTPVTNQNPADPDSEVSKPVNPPLLDHVDILSPSDLAAGESGMIILQPVNNYAGATRLTISLSDGTTKVSKTINIKALGINVIPDVHVAPGGSKTITVPVYDAGIARSIAVTNIGLANTLVGNPEFFKITVPANFTGSFPITIAGAFGGDTSNIVTRSFMVYSQASSGPKMLGGLDNDWGSEPVSQQGQDPYVNFGSAWDGDVLYIASGQTGVRIMDASNPAKPRLIGLLDTPGQARSVQIIGNVAYVADTYGGFVTYDVSDPTRPQMLDQETFSFSAAVNFTIVDGKAYVAEYDSGLAVYDISDPSDMTLLGSLTSDGGFTFLQAVDVAVGGSGYAYVSDAIGKVAVLNVSDPANMSYVTAIDLGADSPWGIDLAHQTLYVADRMTGLKTYDVTDPASPQLLDSLTIAGPLQVTVSGQQVLVGRNHGFAMVDAHDPANLSIAYQVASDDGNPDSGVFGGEAAISDSRRAALPLGNNGFIVMDLTKLYRTTTNYVGVNEAAVSIRISGGGQVLATRLPDGTISRLEVLDSTPKTSVAITSPRGTHADINEIVVDGPLGKLVGTTTRVHGDVTIGGSPATLTLDSIEDGAIMLGAPAPGAVKPVAITIASVTDSSLVSGTPIKSLKLGQWLDTDATDDTITADSLAALTTTGDFQADLTLNGGAAALTLGSAKIGGALTQSAWDISGATGAITLTGSAGGWQGAFGAVKSLTAKANLAVAMTAYSLGTLSVTGNLQDSILNFTMAPVAGNLRLAALGTMTVKGSAVDTVLRSDGNVGSITVGTAEGSTFFAGVSDLVAMRPSDLADFTSDATIGKFTVKGILGQAVAFSDSILAARRLGTVAIVSADPAFDPAKGLSAQTLAKFTYKDTLGNYNWPNAISGDASWPVSFTKFPIIQLV